MDKTDKIVQQLRVQVIEKLERQLNRTIREHIEVEEVLPRHSLSQTQSHLGALYGASSNNKMAAFCVIQTFRDSLKTFIFVVEVYTQVEAFPCVCFQPKL